MSDEKPVPETLGTVAARIDALARSTDDRFAQVDARFEQLESDLEKRFGAVDAALVEQRKYTEFAFEKLRSEMSSGLSEVNSHLGRLDRKIDRVLDVLSTTTPRPRRTS
jgi:hypothetical protein